MTGPWGAALSAAWELRYTLFKVLIFLCLLVLFFIILIVSIPSILLGSVLGDDSTGAQTLQANYNSLAYVVDAAVERGHELALERVEQIISDGGYDYELSMAALIDNAQSAARVRRGLDTRGVLGLARPTGHERRRHGSKARSCGGRYVPGYIHGGQRGCSGNHRLQPSHRDRR